MSKFLKDLDEGIKISLKSGDNALTKAYRNIKSDFIYEKEKSKKSEDEVIKKLHKQRMENRKIYETLNKEDLYKSELDEETILFLYLPIEISKEKLFEFFDTLNISKSKLNFKKYLSESEKQFGQKADSKLILEYITN